MSTRRRSTNAPTLLQSLVFMLAVGTSLGQTIDCGPLAAPDNGQVQFTTTTQNSRAFLFCNEGYILGGASIRICRFTGAWSGLETTCTPVVCVELESPQNGRVTLTGTTFMSTAIYSCNEGYSVDGNMSRTCLSSTQWSGSEPACTVLDCGSLPAPDNGEVLFPMGTVFRSEAMFSCDAGYQVNGIESRFCQLDETWNGTSPTCDPVDCGPLPTLENGDIIVNTTLLNSVAIYSCNEGFKLNSPLATVRYCMANGNWSEYDFKCEIVMCPHLSDPADGNVRFTANNNFKSEAIYTCNDGYEIVGIGSRFCQANGAWNGSSPTCQQVDCGSPPSLANGTIVVRLTTYNSLAGYTCNEGFILNPRNTIRVCLSDSEWSGENPVCDVIDCGPPSVPGNGTTVYITTGYQSTANYNCDFGYELNPITVVRTCSGNEMWSGPDPMCDLLVQCPELSSPERGSVSINSSNDQLPRTSRSLANYQCNTGFTLNDTNTRVCDSSGNWSGMDPLCVDINECEDIPGQVNRNCPQLCVNVVGSFMCDCWQGYVLSGDAINCNDIDECLLSEDNCHSNASCNNTDGGFDCSCDPGFEGDGIECLADCGLLLAPGNGSIFYDNNSTLEGSTANYSCNDGYQISGNSQRVCLASGKWSTATAVCLAEVYVEFEPIEYSVSEGTPFVTLRIVKRTETDREINVVFSTREGTAMSPNDYSERMNLLVTFARDVREEFITITIGNDAVFMDNVEFFCVLTLPADSVGVVLGISEVSVLIIEDEPPNDECVQLSNPTNGRVLMNGIAIGTVVTYECDVGYDLVGAQNRTCNSVGLWTDMEPVCQVVDCGSLPNPLNGIVLLSSTIFESEAQYQCSNNYKLVGLRVRECTETGEWSSTEPICEDIFAVCQLCHENANCIKFGEEVYRCVCAGGFQGDGMNCGDIDECATNADNCHDEAVCSNTVGGFSCSCKAGYQGGGITCSNINECSTDTNNCHRHAICTDTLGSFTCVCKDGFSGDGIVCEAPPCSANFQLILEHITTCNGWKTDNTISKLTDLTEIVTKVINDECEDVCHLVQSQITNTELSCTVENIAVYRGTFDIDTGENCTQLISILGDWINGNPSILVQQIRTKVAPYCDVEFESFEILSDCIGPVDTTTQMEFTTSNGANTLELTMTELIIVVAVGSVIGLLLIVALLVVCCVIAVKMSRRKQNEPVNVIEVTSNTDGNDALDFHETSRQQQREAKNPVKPTYSDFKTTNQNFELASFDPTNKTAASTPYGRRMSSTFQANMVVKNQGATDLEFDGNH